MTPLGEDRRHVLVRHHPSTGFTDHQYTAAGGQLLPLHVLNKSNHHQLFSFPVTFTLFLVTRKLPLFIISRRGSCRRRRGDKKLRLKRSSSAANNSNDDDDSILMNHLSPFHNLAFCMSQNNRQQKIGSGHYKCIHPFPLSHPANPIIPKGELLFPRHNHHMEKILRMQSSSDSDSNLDYSTYETMPDGGVFIDMAHLSSLDGYQSPWSDLEIINTQQQKEKSNRQQKMSIHEWRSKHWIVLIDDEPSIRLAVGDYLHSMGYRVLTACDGPMAFLEVLLWSFAWSLKSTHGNDFWKHGDNTDGEIVHPPWIEDGDGDLTWRLPNCIISDIRMPGFIDGVELLELMRTGADSLAYAAETIEKSSSNNGTKGDESTKTKKGKKSKGNSKGGDDDIIVDKSTNSLTTSEKEILSPTDRATQYLHKIQTLMDFHKQKSNRTDEELTHQYPHSMQQIPFILLTAKAMISDRIRGYEAGADGYIPKPFRPEELLGMIDNLMRKQEREKVNDLKMRKEKHDNNGNVGDKLSQKELKYIADRLQVIKQILESYLPNQ